MNLENKVVVISGGASGLGLARISHEGVKESG